MTMTYLDAFRFLQKNNYRNHYECRYDYFNEQSFNNLKHRNFRTKNGKYRLPNYNTKRSKYKSDGLILHHFYENKFPNLSYLSSIRQHSDFLYQRKENLVYCNLLEHLILHALIFKETKNEKLGIGGYKSLPSQIEKLYLVEESKNEQDEQAKILKSAIGLTWSEVNEVLVASKTLIQR